MYSMKIFDTKQHALVDFVPVNKTVHMYVCGVTPYDAAHLGHIFTFLTYDLLQRRLEDMGHSVRLVRNVTDVDEPIFKRAAENKESYTTLATRETAAFKSIMKQLHFRVPEAEPLASNYIAEMAGVVQKLLATKHAYRLDRDIYFDVSTLPSFGSFSGFPYPLRYAFMKDRGGDPDRPGKRNPLDFLLWRGITDSDDPAAWESPVGYGRPGWHIECSVMSSELLGTPLDLHGGGMDLIFPHHECEIAQSETLRNGPFSRNWMHVAPMLLDGEKMSKSLGNLVFARDLLQNGDAMAVRLALMHYHYRSGGEWRPEVWEEAKRLAAALRGRLTKKGGATKGLLEDVRGLLDANMDTPAVILRLKHHLETQGSVIELQHSMNLLGLHEAEAT